MCGSVNEWVEGGRGGWVGKEGRAYEWEVSNCMRKALDNDKTAISCCI